MPARDATVREPDLVWVITLLDDDPANPAWVLRAVRRRGLLRAGPHAYCRRRSSLGGTRR